MTYATLLNAFVLTFSATIILAGSVFLLGLLRLVLSARGTATPAEAQAAPAAAPAPQAAPRAAAPARRPAPIRRTNAPLPGMRTQRQLRAA